MGVLLAGEGVSPPPGPAILCVGGGDLAGRGWAWHEDEVRRLCFAGIEIPAPAELVANAIDGRGLPGMDRALAIVRLREEIGAHDLLRRLFRRECPRCGANHQERPIAAVRAVLGTRDVCAYVHPGAVEALRRAYVPERYLYQPRIIRPKSEGGPQPDPEVLARKARRYADHLPVFVGEPERTRLAQICYAQQYEARKARR